MKTKLLIFVMFFVILFATGCLKYPLIFECRTLWDPCELYQIDPATGERIDPNEIQITEELIQPNP